ncbi:hypothetical protein G4H71_10940 [Rhodococcus triatomae]|uniref:PEP-CTERM protein-sorting domain-containing protein n=1 Tax=Rhodococcus triatomae TaxID=300028 RepID=A0A1G8LJP6_9NOCA|nr:hypothetical protein [Rhodococcus triatomae]QNG20599.1 hypothetical protein G4H72_19440 [Rhodococcus triatomae]QNG23483.1 hypothetical protein G4H71_10940 [Rhodococcus triatomae]SDI55460.1 hypothetical protein SAMN05444695_108176 [Rhodococcus triatomae]
MHPVAKRQRLDLLVGVLGFFSVMALISAVVELFRPEPGILPGTVLLGCLLLTAGAVVWRRRV